MYELYDYSKLNFILIVEMSPITKLLISSVHTEVSVTVLKSYLQLAGNALGFGIVGAGASWRALGLKTEGVHSTRSFKVSGCIR